MATPPHHDVSLEVSEIKLDGWVRDMNRLDRKLEACEFGYTGTTLKVIPCGERMPK
jgi:hypothetical protein